MEENQPVSQEEAELTAPELDPFEKFEQKRKGGTPDPALEKAKPESVKADAAPAKVEAKEKVIEAEDKGTSVEDEPDELDKLKKELEKKVKALSDTQKWGNKNSQKAKNALKIAQKMIEDGFLTSDEADPLLKILTHDATEEAEELEIREKSSTPLENIYRIANQELGNIRKYTEDEALDKKVVAFDMFIKYSQPQDIKEALEQLEALRDDPVKLTKEMLAIGQKFYEETYKHFEDAGGIKGFSQAQRQKIETLQKKIDKLEKKLQEYEDYDKSPKYKIGDVSESQNENDDSGLDAFDRAKLKMRQKNLAMLR